ncbi:hypothetical protein ACC786_14345 [Rhizobium ruizarguesonis]|uniref:hypothetical protein n=1 Tax=Rhizobium ruizarguesonis TaxID=2081791 RepID=UPI00102F6F9F|nr:hypothetical protein [Rhizobium ruizarguesonis]TAT96062.1 hypothetical protein ELI55_26415 [Rhizobium ruizarguesonis]
MTAYFIADHGSVSAGYIPLNELAIPKALERLRRRLMGTTKPPAEKEASEKATFGSGRGMNFKPLGKRILVSKAHDATPLKIKGLQTGKDRDS